MKKKDLQKQIDDLRKEFVEYKWHQTEMNLKNKPPSDGEIPLLQDERPKFCSQNNGVLFDVYGYKTDKWQEWNGGDNPLPDDVKCFADYDLSHVYCKSKNVAWKIVNHFYIPSNQENPERPDPPQGEDKSEKPTIPEGTLCKFWDNDESRYVIGYYIAFDEKHQRALDKRMTLSGGWYKHAKPLMPSIQEYVNWFLLPESGFRSNEEIYNYFKSHIQGESE